MKTAKRIAKKIEMTLSMLRRRSVSLSMFLWRNLLKFLQLLRRFLKTAWKMIGFVAVVIGLIASLYTFYPHLSVEPGLILDPYNPFENPFKIYNNSIMDLDNLTYTLTPLYIQLKDDIPIVGQKDTRLIRGYNNKRRVIKTLKPGEKTNVFVNEFITISPPIAEIDIILNVNFSLFWTSKEKRFRFKVAKNTKNETYWQEMALSEEISHEPYISK